MIFTISNPLQINVRMMRLGVNAQLP